MTTAEIADAVPLGSRWKCHQRDHAWEVEVTMVTVNRIGFHVVRGPGTARGRSKKLNPLKFLKDFERR